MLKETCRHCQLIKKDWYSHLKASGFEDIEKGMRLVDHKTVEDLAYRKDFHTQNQFEAKVNYSLWATQMLELGSFRSMMDQMIWEYHSDGLSRREISERIDLNDRWISRKIIQIKSYLSNSSQCATYG